MAIFTTLRDGFNGGSIDTALWDISQTGGATITQSGGKLVVTPVSSASPAYALVYSDLTYDLTESSIKVRVDQVASTSSNADTYMKVVNATNTNSFTIRKNGTRLYFETYNGVSFDVSFVTYNASTHLWWKIRHSSSTIYFDTSTDNVFWTNRYSLATPFAITSLHAEIGAGTFAVASPLQNALFDNVNIGTYVKEAKGTLTFSGTATRKLKAYREAEGTLVFSGNALAIRKSDPTRIELKQFLYKIYDEDDNFLGVWDDVVSDPGWSEELNSSGSSTTVTLARNSDSKIVDYESLQDETGALILDENDFEILTSIESRNKVGVGSDLAHNYRVDIYAYYGEEDVILDEDDLPILDEDGQEIIGVTGSPNGIRRFTGFVSEINIQYGNTENTQVQLMSYGFDLDQYIVTNGGFTTIDWASADPSTIVKDALTLFSAQATESYTTYDNSTVEMTGTSVSYTFRSNTYLELLKKSIELAPTGWYWYVDLGTNLVNFKEKSATPHHYFYLGKHIQSLSLRSYIGDVVNDVLFTGGGDPALYKRYTETPLANTRRGLKRISDNRVTLAASAEILSEGEIDDNINVQYRSTVTILDKTYDIESIKVGDVVAFRNFGTYVDEVTMQIAALSYTPEAITLQLDTLPDNTNKRLEDLRRNLKLQENETVPTAPS